ncbi:NADP-dependent oxidoreductase domain-containing protein [Coemansia spiralis]|nr:NADP-dependent oxidoreductase domain-containing protein [Coemansia spiralis]
MADSTGGDGLLIVKFKDGATDAQRQAVKDSITGNHGIIDKDMSNIGIIVFKPGNSDEFTSLQQHDAIEVVEKDSIYKTQQKVFDYYYEHGGNFVDTANVYNDGESEKILGDLISDKRSEIVVTSKYTRGRNFGRMIGGNSLKKHNRLRTGYLDVFYAHFYDWVTPIEETIRALDDVVRAGKTSYIAVSDMPSWAISRTKCSLLDRSYEYDLLPAAAYLGLRTIAWGILESGLLIGKYQRSGFENNKAGSTG